MQLAASSSRGVFAGLDPPSYDVPVAALHGRTVHDQHLAGVASRHEYRDLGPCPHDPSLDDAAESLTTAGVAARRERARSGRILEPSAIEAPVG